ncbi:hypothetical protein [Mycolicibacterium goodii]|uniref:hypothetical protein n=1 Tax=Mycolicibacterium goodii TaxID=134601 RepID=UPI0027DEE9BF|nr:hypothetical protein [Mycolicibacterium goodii]
MGVPAAGAVVGIGEVGDGLALVVCVVVAGADKSGCEVGAASRPPDPHPATSTDAAMITAVRIPPG